jgi:hypothetical protein
LTCAVCDAARPVVTNSGSSKWIRAVHLLGNNDGSYLVLDLSAHRLFISSPFPFLLLLIIISSWRCR